MSNVAAIGLVITSAILILGAGLNTEFIFGLATPGMIPATDVSMYSHRVATISWLWVAAGASAVALGLASFKGAAPRWIGVVSLVLGALTVLLGVSPLQYMAGFVGPVWLLVVALGFLPGDRRHHRLRPGLSTKVERWGPADDHRRGTWPAGRLRFTGAAWAVAVGCWVLCLAALVLFFTSTGPESFSDDWLFVVTDATMAAVYGTVASLLLSPASGTL